MAYETLFDILRKEKSREELQELPEEFYGLVSAFVMRKQAEIDAAGGSMAPQAQKLMIQYRNIQKILKELYERRERKIMQMAINRARTASNLIDTDTLLAQEKFLYETAASILKSEKEKLLEPLLNGRPPEGVTPIEAPIPEEPHHGKDRKEPANKEPSKEVESADTTTIVSKESCDVKFLAAVPKFLGLNGQIHGPFQPGDQAQLPGKIAAVLLKKNRVELA